MKLVNLALAGMFLILSGAPSALADTVVLRDGTRLSGTFLKGSTRSITLLDDNNQQHTLDIRDVRYVDFSSSSPPPGTSRRRDASPHREKGPGNSQAGIIIVPTGTQIVVRTNESISSAQADDGRTYDAEIEQDVPDTNGAVAIPKGSSARLIVRKASEGGTLSSGELTLDLQSVSLEGREYLLSTTDLDKNGRAGLGKNSRTGALVGGGAILGTLLGVIAGGGKGAAIGALAGAGAGAGVQILTRGKEVRVPAETVLTFALDQPLRLSRN